MITSLIAGNSIRIPLIFKRDGVAFDITGAEVYYTVKQSYNTNYDDAIIAKVITEHTDAAGGITQIVVEPDETLNLAAGKYVSDITIKFDDENITTVYRGKIDISSGENYE
jgi:hypothetical protein